MHTPISVMAYLLAACTFPIKNDRIDTAAEEVITDFGEIDVIDIDTCDADNLITFTEVRVGGETVETLAPGQNAQVWAVVGNQCKNEILFATETGCLVEGWSVNLSSGGSASGAFICDPDAVDRTLRSGQTLQRMVAPLNDLPLGIYTGTVNFSLVSSGGEIVTETFTVSVSGI